MGFAFPCVYSGMDETLYFPYFLSGCIGVENTDQMEIAGICIPFKLVLRILS